MAALADRVKESTATTGQGTVTLAGAAVGFRSFTAAFGNGVSVYYVIAGGAEWEVGIGTTGAGTLSRDTVIGSSAGGTTKVTFSAGTKDVFCSVPASRLVLTDNLASANTANAVVQRDGSGNFAAGTITAALSGNASTATALQTARNINGVSFNGTADITVTAAAGTLTGTTLASNVVSSSLTSVGTLTNLTVTNTITGSVSGSSGSTTGNAATATALQTARNINGVSFNGTADITVTAAAGTLSGNTLASGVTASSLTSVGTLSSLTVSGNGVFGPENGRSVDTSYIRVYGGTIATAGANLLVFGDSHPSAPGRLSLSASGTGHVEINTGGLQRFLLDASGNLAVDTSTLFVDAVNNRVGVGTTNPNAFGLFTVEGAGIGGHFNSTSGASGINFYEGGVGRFGLRTLNGTAGLSFYDTFNNTERARLDASGNLGLGVTPSGWDSGKAFEIGVAGNAMWSSAGSLNLTQNAAFASAAYRYLANATAARYHLNGNVHEWYTAASGTAGNAITFTQAMTLDASGNLGVGTTSLNLNGNNQAITVRSAQSGTTSAGVDIGGYRTTDGTVGQLTYFNGANLMALVNVSRRGADNSSSLEFYTANAGSIAERARITADGYFKASDAGTYAGSTASYHELRGSASGLMALFSNTHASTPSGSQIKFTAAAPNNATQYFVTCEDSTNERATIRSNGGLANYQSNNVDLSDIRTKTDIAPVASMWGKINALEIVQYKYAYQTHDDVNVGVIAQQVETVEPVWVDADGFGTTPDDGVPLKTVYTKDITFAAIKALQEAMARIETLEQRVMALEA